VVPVLRREPGAKRPASVPDGPTHEALVAASVADRPGRSRAGRPDRAPGARRRAGPVRVRDPVRAAPARPLSAVAPAGPGHRPGRTPSSGLYLKVIKTVMGILEVRLP
jgi:hypothetical protein